MNRANSANQVVTALERAALRGEGHKMRQPQNPQPSHYEVSRLAHGIAAVDISPQVPTLRSYRTKNRILTNPRNVCADLGRE